MYKNIKRLKLKIEGHYNIVEYTQVFPEGSAVETSMGIIVEKQRKLQIKGIGDALVYLAENKEVTKSVKEEASIIQRRIYNQYEKIHEFLGKKAALSALLELNVKTEGAGKPIKPTPYRDSRRFNNFYHALLFTALVDEHVFKRKMLETFPIGSIHTKEEILTRINSVYARADVGIIELKNLVPAMRCLKTYFKVRTLRRKKDAKKEEDKIVQHKIMGLNPYDLKLIKKLGKDIKTNAMFSGLILPDKNYSANDADYDFYGFGRIGEVEEAGKE